MTTNVSSTAGATAKDPVCGMSVAVAQAKFRYDYKGKSYYFCCAGCLEKFKAAAEKYLQGSAGSQLVTLGASAQSAANQKDPVCGMDVNPATAKYKTDFAGRTYYFCCAGCLEKFRSDPEKYLKPRPAKLTPITATPSKTSLPVENKGQAYVCPMCPEVRKRKPGACPSCGMALEPETPVSRTRVEYT